MQYSRYSVLKAMGKRSTFGNTCIWTFNFAFLHEVWRRCYCGFIYL